MSKITRQMLSDILKEKTHGENIIEFCCHPLKSMYAHTLLHSTNDYTSYEGIFEDRDSLINFMPEKVYPPITEDDPTFKESEEYIDSIITYFKEELTWRRVLGSVEFTEWEKELKIFLDMSEQNKCKEKHLTMFCKLPQFYEDNIAFDKIYQDNNCAQLKIKDGEQFYEKGTATWSYLGKIKKSKKHEKKYTFYYFKDQDSHLYEIKQFKSESLDSMIELLWDKPIKVETVVKSRTKWSTGATYYSGESFTISG